MIGFFLITSVIESLSANKLPSIPLVGLDRLAVSTCCLLGSLLKEALLSSLTLCKNPLLPLAVEVPSIASVPFLIMLKGLKKSIIDNLSLPLESSPSGFIGFLPLRIGPVLAREEVVAVDCPSPNLLLTADIGFPLLLFNGVGLRTDCVIGLFPLPESFIELKVAPLP